MLCMFSVKEHQVEVVVQLDKNRRNSKKNTKINTVYWDMKVHLEF